MLLTIWRQTCPLCSNNLPMSSSTFPHSSLAAYSLTVPNTTRSSKYKEHFQLFYPSGTSLRTGDTNTSPASDTFLPPSHWLRGAPSTATRLYSRCPKKPSFPPQDLERTVSSEVTTQLKKLCFRWHLQPQHCSQKIKESTSMWAVVSGVPEGTWRHLSPSY